MGMVVVALLLPGWLRLQTACCSSKQEEEQQEEQQQEEQEEEEGEEQQQPNGLVSKTLAMVAAAARCVGWDW